MKEPNVLRVWGSGPSGPWTFELHMYLLKLFSAS